MSKYENVHECFGLLGLGVIPARLHGSELGTESDFVCHQDNPATDLITLFFRPAHQGTDDNHTVALLELVGELFDIELFSPIPSIEPLQACRLFLHQHTPVLLWSSSEAWRRPSCAGLLCFRVGIGGPGAW